MDKTAKVDKTVKADKTVMAREYNGEDNSLNTLNELKTPKVPLQCQAEAS